MTKREWCKFWGLKGREADELWAEKQRMTKRIGPQIIQDIKPYITAAIDKERGGRIIVKSRREHREFLRRNDYVEYPDFKPTPEHLRPGNEMA
jgi:hypothetical protein